jgi:hypothetical protein
MPKLNRIGYKYGKLLVTEESSPIKKQIAWKCLCECGKYHVVIGRYLTRGEVKSCGCLKNETNKDVLVTHGLSKTIEYKLWKKMRGRCNNPNSPDYKSYGGRGIGISDRWNTFKFFLEDMGNRPSIDYQLDRIDNNKGYSKENCKWSTRIEQANNRRDNVKIEFNGIMETVATLSRKYNINYGTLITRLNSGQSVYDAVTIPLETSNSKRLRSQRPEALLAASERAKLYFSDPIARVRMSLASTTHDAKKANRPYSTLPREAA